MLVEDSRWATTRNPKTVGRIFVIGGAEASSLMV